MHMFHIKPQVVYLFSMLFQEIVVDGGPNNKSNKFQFHRTQRGNLGGNSCSVLSSAYSFSQDN